MNGIPMKLDYSKTINEQLDTFNYYKDRYTCYELELMRNREQITQLTNNWNELEEWLESNWKDTQDIWYVKIINKMKEIQNGDNE